MFVVSNITFNDVKTALIDDLNIPGDQIAIATGSVWELATCSWKSLGLTSLTK